MSKIISIHSFRGGTGKSNTTANLAAILASQGLKVGVVDTDIQSPGIHILFGLHGQDIGRSLNDYLWGNCSIEETATDVTGNLGVDVSGQVLLIPSSMDAGNIARVLHEGYDVGVMSAGLRALIDALGLDILFIDTHPGLNEETLLSLALSTVLIVVLRPDEQDFEGTGVTIRVAQRLKVPRMLIVINKVPQVYDVADVQKQVEQTYSAEVAAVLPHSDELMALASRGIFSMQFPDHPVTELYKAIAAKLMAA
jgi:MinD-like ATPase involved in chromosome partitioning or flagellar assembly